MTEQELQMMTTMRKLEVLKETLFITAKGTEKESEDALEAGNLIIDHLNTIAKGQGFLSDEEFLKRHAELFHRTTEPVSCNTPGEVY